MLLSNTSALLVHGFNVDDLGEGSTDRLAPCLYESGFQVKEADYGCMNILGATLCNRHIAHTLARTAPLGAIGVGHSNGCAILAQASLYIHNRMTGLVLINPALNTKTKFGSSVKFIHVYHAPSDAVVQLSSLLPFHIWGAMGRVGYKGDDPRVVNYELPFKGHTGLFDKWDKQYANTMIERMLKTLASTT